MDPGARHDHDDTIGNTTGDARRAARGGSGARYRNVGGTSGGLGEFLVAVALLATGGWLLLGRITVMSGADAFFGHSWFGWTLVLLFLGLTFLFFDGGSLLGWLLVAAGLLAMGAALLGLLVNLHVFYRPTSLLETVGILGLNAAGLGLLLRSIRAH